MHGRSTQGFERTLRTRFEASRRTFVQSADSSSRHFKSCLTCLSKTNKCRNTSSCVLKLERVFVICHTSLTTLRQWQDVVSLEYIDVCTIIFLLIAPAMPLTRRNQLDMIAWVSYCDDPAGKTWRRILESRKPAIDVSDRRVARHCRIHLERSPKQEFQVEARSQNPSLSDDYDRLLSRYPWPQ